ncbi:hypothetical protein EON65_23185 [archaeon]|nr:MAG: hypothetical protein EON65_23185 [archaeon]
MFSAYRGEERQIYLQRLHQRKIEAAYEIYVFWKKARIRRYCHFILYVGHLKKLEDFIKQQEEERSFEERTAQRMQYEQREVRTYLTKLRHTKKETARKEKERFTDDQLFAADHEHMRPDLAPFSTHYFNMIQNLAKAATLADHSAYNNQEPDEQALSVKIAERRSQSFQAVLRPEDSYPVIAPSGSPRAGSRTSTAAMHHMAYTPTHPPSSLSPRHSKLNTVSFIGGGNDTAFMQSPMRHASFNRGHTPGSSPTRGSFTPNRGGSVSYNLHEEFNSNAGMFSGQVSGIDSSNTSHQITHTNLSAWWEQLANVDISIAQLQQQREVEKVERNSKNKSSAYKALERLCGLTEEHIQRQNEKYKVKGRKVSTSFLHSGVL